MDVCSKKKIEFLELKQENSTVAEYATKFEELVKFYQHYNSVDVEGLNASSLRGVASRDQTSCSLPGDLSLFYIGE